MLTDPIADMITRIRNGGHARHNQVACPASKQKLAIACGLLHSPSVLMFDEPLTGLDPLGIRRMKDSILKRARAGAAIILSSHLLHLLEEVCSHVLILKRGEKIADGTLAQHNGLLKFTNDSEFSSPSTAAAVIHGGGANGLVEWKTMDGTTLKELDEKA